MARFDYEALKDHRRKIEQSPNLPTTVLALKGAVLFILDWLENLPLVEINQKEKKMVEPKQIPEEERPCQFPCPHCNQRLIQYPFYLKIFYHCLSCDKYFTSWSNGREFQENNDLDAQLITYVPVGSHSRIRRALKATKGWQDIQLKEEGKDG